MIMDTIANCSPAARGSRSYTFAVTPAFCHFPAFETLLNIFPLVAPEGRSQASRSCLDMTAPALFAARLPLPIKSTMPSALPRLQLVPRESDNFQNVAIHTPEVCRDLLGPDTPRAWSDIRFSRRKSFRTLLASTATRGRQETGRA